MTNINYIKDIDKIVCISNYYSGELYHTKAIYVEGTRRSIWVGNADSDHVEADRLTNANELLFLNYLSCYYDGYSDNDIFVGKYVNFNHSKNNDKY